jgi:hypothetical protein
MKIKDKNKKKSKKDKILIEKGMDSSLNSSFVRKKEEMGKAQIWSIDVLLALVIFVAIILIFYTTINSKQSPGLKEMQIEATSVKATLEKNALIGFINSDKIDSAKLQIFNNRVESDYEEVKEELGLRGDFCIFYEDEEGNLIPMDDKIGIGNSTEKLLINGKRCGSII